MFRCIFTLIIFLTFSCFSFSVWAEEGYIGEDLWNDIYKRIDEGIYKLKTQMVENRLKDSALLINGIVWMTCTSKEWEPIFCFRDGLDFTTSELDEISAGSLGPIYVHMNPTSMGINTEQAVRIRGIVMEYYQLLQSQITNDQKKLQSVGSIGLFTDGNKDNSSYDLMVDMENIHSVLFAKDIPYNGTSNMGASSLSNLLSNSYAHPFSPLNNLIAPNEMNSWASLPPLNNLSGSVTLTGIINKGSECLPLEQPPLNLDQNFLRDVQSQLLLWTSSNSSLAFSDNGNLPEYWAGVAQWNGGSVGSSGGGSDKFPCSWKDFFCIIVSMTTYAQNILWGWKAATIEKILDENLKIADKFAPSSFVQSKMTKMFFGLSLKNLDLPSMLHIGVIVSRLPPPILNLKPGTTGGPENAGAPDSKGEQDEFNQILVWTFEEVWIDFKRQNSLEKNNESRMVNNLSDLTTNIVPEKSDTSQTPMKSGYIQAKDMELKKGYGDSFNDDLFELHDFTLAFSKSIKNLTDVIKAMHAIPQK